MHVCMCVRTYVHNCIIVSPYVCTYVRTYVRTHACTYAHTYVRMHVCMYVCMHVCMHLYMYVCLFLIVNVKVFNSTWNVNLIYFPREMWKGVFFSLWIVIRDPPCPPPPPPPVNVVFQSQCFKPGSVIYITPPPPTHPNPFGLYLRSNKQPRPPVIVISIFTVRKLLMRWHVVHRWRDKVKVERLQGSQVTG